MATPRFVFGVTAADAGTSRVLIATAAAAVGIVWCLWMATLAFRSIDEFQREAGKFAWYWGGAMGLAASLVAYVFVGMGGMHWLDPAHYSLGPELFRAFKWGYLIGVGFPIAGFLLARLFWQVTRR